MKSLTEVIRGEIRAELARHELGQKDLASAWNISQPAVAKKLNGKTAINDREIEQAAHLFGFTVFDFVARAGQNARRAA